MKELPRSTPEEIVEELRDKAREEADDLNLEISPTAVRLGVARLWSPEDMIEWEAADCIEDLLKRLNEK
ncbi:hypothetical protein V5F34_01030 [Xanthobacter autotrophicus]|uniref:hypothetical protein n=1 Tax=Xanthobacter autotrophicus TaxID=280 RepID=UPI003726A974